MGLIGVTGSDLRRFLSHFKAQRLVDLTTDQYGEAIKMLRSKAKLVTPAVTAEGVK